MKLSEDFETTTEPPEERVKQLLTILRGFEVVLETRRRWTWRLGPETWVDTQVNGPVGPREVNAFLQYALALPHTLTEPTKASVLLAQPTPADPEGKHED